MRIAVFERYIVQNVHHGLFLQQYNTKIRSVKNTFVRTCAYTEICACVCSLPFRFVVLEVKHERFVLRPTETDSKVKITKRLVLSQLESLRLKRTAECYARERP